MNNNFFCGKQEALKMYNACKCRSIRCKMLFHAEQPFLCLYSIEYKLPHRLSLPEYVGQYLARLYYKFHEKLLY